MKVLLFSDVHSNLEALEAVLADAYARGFDQALCLGDIVGYGANPEECVGKVRSVPSLKAVLGNHDAAVLDPRRSGYLNPVAQAGVKYSSSKLTAGSVQYLASLPFMIESDDAFVACHASPNRPEEWIYVLEPMEAREAFRAMTRPLAFIGHTHYAAFYNGAGRMRPIFPNEPMRIRRQEKCIVNVGSVGQPRDGDPRAAYVIFDDRRRVAEVFRVDYDVVATARKILEAGLPAMLADRIQRGY